MPWSIRIRLSFWGTVESDNDLETAPAPDRQNPNNEIETAVTSSAQFLGAMTVNIMFGGLSLIQSLPLNAQPLPSDLKTRVANIVNNPQTDCAEFIKKVIGNLKGKAFSDNPMKLFERVENEKGFKLGNTGKYGGVADMPSGKRQVRIRRVGSTTDPQLAEHQAYAYAVTALNELMHHAKDSGLYSDRELARAIAQVLPPDQLAANPLPKTDDAEKNSAYFHSLFKLHCPSVTGE